MMKLEVPSVINAAGLLPFMALLGSVPEVETDIVVDFGALRRVSPAGLVTLVATIKRWQSGHLHRVRLEGLDRCGICGYLQRMDVLRVCGMELPETFERHPARGRFVPVQTIVDVDSMSKEVAACLAPGGDDYEHPLAPIYDLVGYVLGELGANVRQHSLGSGFVAAQTDIGAGLVRLAVADNGKGVRQSFVEAGLKWSHGISDSAALKKAIEPQISSKGEPVNQGVGLTLVSHLAQLTQAWLLIVSGTGLLKIAPDGTVEEDVLPSGSRYQGTLVTLTFRGDKLRAFADLLHEAKQDAGLFAKRPIKTTFT